MSRLEKSASMKHVLAALRNGDFAHPGEIEAIEMAFRSIAKKPQQWLLDVGCGLGGTAHHLQQHGWGQVVGLDLDASLIEYAKQHYTDVNFFHCDVLRAQSLIQRKFDVIYCFSSFFCFPKQQETLAHLAHMAASQCDLVIFDYSRSEQKAVESPFPWSETARRFYPIHVSELKEMLSSSGWNFQHSVDISAQFAQWYTELIHQFEQKQGELLKKFDPQLLQALHTGYTQLLNDIKENRVGGVLIYATKQQ